MVCVENNDHPRANMLESQFQAASSSFDHPPAFSRNLLSLAYELRKSTFQTKPRDTRMNIFSLNEPREQIKIPKILIHDMTRFIMKSSYIFQTIIFNFFYSGSTNYGLLA